MSEHFIRTKLSREFLSGYTVNNSNPKLRVCRSIFYASAAEWVTEARKILRKRLFFCSGSSIACPEHNQELPANSSLFKMRISLLILRIVSNRRWETSTLEEDLSIDTIFIALGQVIEKIDLSGERMWLEKFSDIPAGTNSLQGWLSTYDRFFVFRALDTRSTTVFFFARKNFRDFCPNVR